MTLTVFGRCYLRSFSSSNDTIIASVLYRVREQPWEGRASGSSKNVTDMSISIRFQTRFILEGKWKVPLKFRV